MFCNYLNIAIGSIAAEENGNLLQLQYRYCSFVQRDVAECLVDVENPELGLVQAKKAGEMPQGTRARWESLQDVGWRHRGDVKVA